MMILENVWVFLSFLNLGNCQLGLLGDNSPLGFLGGLISPSQNRETTTHKYGGDLDLVDIWGGGTNSGNSGNFGGGNRGRGNYRPYQPKPKPKPNTPPPINYYNSDYSASIGDRFGGVDGGNDNDAFLNNQFNNNPNTDNYYSNDNYNNRPNKGNGNKGTGNKGNSGSSGNNGNRPWTGGSNWGGSQNNQWGGGNNNDDNNENNFSNNNGGGNKPNNKGNGSNANKGNKGNSENNGNKNNTNNKGNKGNNPNSNKNKDKFNMSTAGPERDDLTTPERTTPTTVTPTPTKSRTTTTPATDPEECLETVTMVGGKPACSGELIFKDNFGHLNRDKWDPEVRFAGSPDYEFVLYVNDSKNLHISEKKLCIKPTLLDEKYGDGYTLDTNFFDLGETCTAQKGSTDCVQSPQAFIILPPVESARINTKNHFNFLYGTVEIRAKLPKGDWIYPELYLTPTTNAYGPDYESGAIRIAFLPGNADISSTLSGGCILGSTKSARAFAMKTITSNRSWADTYHKFTVKWKPESITMYVDDEVYGKIVAPEGGFATEAESLGIENGAEWKKGASFAPFDKEMYLTIGVGVGGQCFEDRESKPYKNRDPKAQRRFYNAKETWLKTWTTDSVLQIDYVNVIAL